MWGCNYKDALPLIILEGEPMSLGVLNSSSRPRKVLGVLKVNY